MCKGKKMPAISESKERRFHDNEVKKEENGREMMMKKKEKKYPNAWSYTRWLTYFILSIVWQSIYDCILIADNLVICKLSFLMTKQVFHILLFILGL